MLTIHFISRHEGLNAAFSTTRNTELFISFLIAALKVNSIYTAKKYILINIYFPQRALQSSTQSSLF